MSLAFGEHLMFLLPVDGGTSFKENIGIEHPSDEDTPITEPSHHSSVDFDSEWRMDMKIVAPPTKVLLSECIAHKKCLLNTAISLLYNCYRAECDKLDAMCVSTYIIGSIGNFNSQYGGFS